MDLNGEQYSILNFFNGNLSDLLGIYHSPLTVTLTYFFIKLQAFVAMMMYWRSGNILSTAWAWGTIIAVITIENVNSKN